MVSWLPTRGTAAMLTVHSYALDGFMMIYAQICRLLKTSSISIESDWKYKPGQEQFAP
jgi:hypothetical protein